MGVTLSPRRVDPLDRILFNTYWFADHFLGKRDVVGKSRSALAERMLRKFEGQEKGKIRPIARVRKIERGEFVREFVKKGIPVVLEGFARDWDCTSQWTPEFFASEFGDYETTIVDRVNEGDVGRETLPLREIVEGMRAGSRKYARFIPILHDHPELLESFDLESLQQLKGSFTVGTSFQFFLGPKDAITAIHAASSSNFFIQIFGEKRWLFFSPANNPMLSPRVDRMPYFISDVDVANPDFEKNPALEYADGLEAHLEQGDVLYNPPFYWHHITNLTDSIAAGIRWMDPGVLVKNSPMLTALSALATKPNLLSAYLATRSGLLMPSWYWDKYKKITLEESKSSNEG